jgi:hypothetical protein
MTDESIKTKEQIEQQLKDIEINLEWGLENCACMGRDAYGSYVEKVKEMLMEKINKLVNINYDK